MRLTFLGTGTSHGIPVPGCACRVCRSADPKDNRMRTSVLLEKEGKNLVVDTGPEFRMQALRAGIMHLEGVLYTHSHADHFNGLDDLRAYCKERTLDVYGDQEVLEHMHRCYGYAFRRPDGPLDRLPHLASHFLEPLKTVSIAGFSVTPIPLLHGSQTIYGYKIDDLVYATDCNRIPDISRPFMQGAKVLVLDALRPSKHPTHFSIGEAVSEARSLGAEECYLIHFCHEVCHQELAASLPEHIRPAYDTLSLEVGPCA